MKFLGKIGWIIAFHDHRCGWCPPLPPSMGNTWSATDTDLLETALAVIVKDRYSTHFFASLTLSLRARYGRNFNGSLYASVKWKHLHSWGLLLVFGYVDRCMAVNITCRNTSLISREKLNSPCSWIQWLFMDSNWLYQIASTLFVHTIKTVNYGFQYQIWTHFDCH